MLLICMSCCHEQCIPRECTCSKRYGAARAVLVGACSNLGVCKPHAASPPARDYYRMCAVAVHSHVCRAYVAKSLLVELVRRLQTVEHLRNLQTSTPEHSCAADQL